MRTIVGLTILGITSSAVAQPLNLQAMCATQAKKAFEEWQGDNKSGMDNYTNHYNTKLGKCLVLIEHGVMSGSTPTKIKVLMDAFERRIYADYSSTWCELTPSLRQTKACSEAEFDAFVAAYMEE